MPCCCCCLIFAEEDHDNDMPPNTCRNTDYNNSGLLRILVILLRIIRTIKDYSKGNYFFK